MSIVFICHRFGCLSREGCDEPRKGGAGGGGGQGREGPVILSLGVPFDSLQPSAHFLIQCGGSNSRTKDYSALAPHKIHLYYRITS